MKSSIKILVFAIPIVFLIGCSDHIEMNNLIARKWEKCSNKDNCIFDFSISMDFEWDKMFYFSSAFSLEEINEKLGTELRNFTDTGDRLIFMNDDRVVYHQEWFYNPSVTPQGTAFSIDDKYLEVGKENAKFKINKTKSLYYLEYLE
jgi:hypothetical protein